MSKQHLNLLTTLSEILSLHLLKLPSPGSPFISLWFLPFHSPLQSFLLIFICWCFSGLVLRLLLFSHCSSKVTSHVLYYFGQDYSNSLMTGRYSCLQSIINTPMMVFLQSKFDYNTQNQVNVFILPFESSPNDL